MCECGGLAAKHGVLEFLLAQFTGTLEYREGGCGLGEVSQQEGRKERCSFSSDVLGLPAEQFLCLGLSKDVPPLYYSLKVLIIVSADLRGTPYLNQQC